MKICTGIVSEADIKLLAQAGADEFFCGILPLEWRRKFGPEISPNARTILFSNCLNYSQLRKVIVAAHRINKKIYVNFNAHFYAGDELPLLRKMIEKSMDYGADALIVADIGLLQNIKEWKIDANIILSGEFGARNAYDVRIVGEHFNLSRVILPRHMSFENMESLVSEFPQYEFEAFAMLGRCLFDGANCMPTHTQDRSLDLGRFFCADFIDSRKSFLVHDDNFYSYFRGANNALFEYANRNTINSLVVHDSQKHEHLPTACGLCAIPRFKKMGIASLKVPTRGTVNPHSLVAVRVVRKVVDGQFSLKEIKKLYSKSFKGCVSGMCDAGYMCYYNN